MSGMSWGRRVIVPAFLTLLALAGAARLAQPQVPAHPPGASVRLGMPALEARIARWDTTVADWRAKGRTCLELAIAIGGIGLVIGLLQTLKKGLGRILPKSPARLDIVVACLGFLSSLAALLNTTIYPADYRAYRKVADQASVKLDEIRDRIYEYPTEPERRLMVEDIRKRLDDLDELRRAFVADAKPLVVSLELTPVAYAQSLKRGPQRPDWVAKPPSDPDALYVVGVASHPSLETAKDLSFKNALDILAEELATHVPSEAKGYSADALAKYASSAAKPMDTYFSRDATSKAYVYYTLVRLLRESIETGIVSFGARESVSVSKGMLEAVGGTQIERSSEEYYLKRQQAYEGLLADARSRLPREAAQMLDTGRAYRRSGDYARALQAFESVVKAAPDTFLGWYNLGLVYEAQGDVAKAEEAYRRAVSQEPHQVVRDASVYNTYGWLLFRAGRYAEAERLFVQALAIEPAHPKAQANLAATRAKLAQ